MRGDCYRDVVMFTANDLEWLSIEHETGGFACVTRSIYRLKALSYYQSTVGFVTTARLPRFHTSAASLCRHSRSSRHHVARTAGAFEVGAPLERILVDVLSCSAAGSPANSCLQAVYTSKLRLSIDVAPRRRDELLHVVVLVAFCESVWYVCPKSASVEKMFDCMAVQGIRDPGGSA